MLAIFDMSTINIERYNSELLKTYDENYVAYVDDPDLCTPTKFKNCKLVCTSWWKISKLIKNFRDNNISLIIISGQRPADLRILISANFLDIPVIYKMHGLYIPHMKRGFSFYILKLMKALRTLFYLLDIACYKRSLDVSVGMLRSFIFGYPRNCWANCKELRIDIGLIWSEYWRSWHEEHWAIVPKIGWFEVGNPDTVKFKTVSVDDESLIYVYQTLVEDGRIDAKKMNNFYNILESSSRISKKTIHVKWHPRGDEKTKRELISRGFIIHDDLPKGKYYIGHYSSLLGIAPLMNGHVIIAELDGHPTPKPIREIANIVLKDLESLRVTLETPLPNFELKNNEAIYFFGDHYNKNVEQSLICEYITNDGK